MEVETDLSRMCLALRKPALKNQGPPYGSRISFSVISLGDEESRWNRGRMGGGSWQNSLISNVNSVHWKQWPEPFHWTSNDMILYIKTGSDSSLLEEIKEPFHCQHRHGTELVIWVLEKINTYREWVSQSRIDNLVVQLKKVPLKQVSFCGGAISNNNQSKTNNPEWTHSDFHHRAH